MKKNYKPTTYAKDIYSINYQKLLNQNINILLFDIDNTIGDNTDKTPNQKAIELFKKLKKDGFQIFIISNAFKKRAIRYGKVLDTKAYYFSIKPLKRQYIRIIKENKLSNENIAAIGDQLLTDILGANKMKIVSILVDPISKNESILTKINRIKENKLIKKYNLLEKGKYYE
jgi:HAD superfamily phosphatase (TIGR01668 family)